MLAAAGCRRDAVPDAGRPELPAVAVRIAVAGERELEPTEEVMGTVRARHHAAVESRVTARIESLAVAPGSRVAAGDVVAVLDARDLRAQRSQAVARHGRAAADLARIERLAKEGAAPPADLDAGRERLEVAAAALVEAETGLAHARVVAPFAGVVSRKWADAGDQATPGRPIVDIEELASLRLELDVPESLVRRVPLGTRLAVRLGAGDASLEGVVGEVAPIADPATRTLAVKLDLPASPATHPGQFGRAYIPLDELPVTQVPAAALVRRGAMEMVFVVATNGRANLRLVRSGRAATGVVELVSGIKPGESVVVDGAAGLVDGQRVEVRP